MICLMISTHVSNGLWLKKDLLYLWWTELQWGFIINLLFPIQNILNNLVEVLAE